MLICRISCRTSAGTVADPDDVSISTASNIGNLRDATEARCRAGRMASASRAFGHRRQTQPRTIRSMAINGIRPGLPRRSTTICCRSTRISASSAARGRNRSTTALNNSGRDPTSRRGSSDSAADANRMEFTTGTGVNSLLCSAARGRVVARSARAASRTDADDWHSVWKSRPADWRANPANFAFCSDRGVAK